MSQQIETQVGLFRSFLEKIRQGSVDMMERLSVVESLFQNQQENSDSVLRCEIFEISLNMQFQIIHKDHSHKYGIKTRATENGNLQSGSMDQRTSHNISSVKMDLSQIMQILLAKLG